MSSGEQGSVLLRGAGLAGLSRLGAVIEIATQSLFIWLVGLPAFGLYATLWAGVVLLATLVDLAFTSALQRLIPQLDDDSAHATIKTAALISVGSAILVAAGVWLGSDRIADGLSAPPELRQALPLLISLFVWALPLWTFVELSTSALRARRAFGPEIRIRVFWEQIVRMAFAGVFFAGGAGEFTLVAAHLASLVLSCGMCVRLLGRYYGLPALLRAPLTRPLTARLLLTGAGLFPSNLARRTLIHGPAICLNLMLPGARGATAAGLFEVARRLATVPYFVRQSFEYVLAPLSAGSSDEEIGRLYGLATRMTCALVLPLSAFLIFAARDVLSLYRPEVLAALPMLVILVVGRTFDAAAGPAQTIVEMTRHRALPLLNNAIGIGLWLALLVALVPVMGGEGMALAVAAATTATAWAAVAQIRSLPGSIAGRRLWTCVLIAAVGGAIMAAIAASPGGPLRFAALTAVWLAATWANLRWGIEAADKAALGRIGVRLRLG